MDFLDNKDTEISVTSKYILNGFKVFILALAQKVRYKPGKPQAVVPDYDIACYFVAIKNVNGPVELNLHLVVNRRVHFAQSYYGNAHLLEEANKRELFDIKADLAQRLMLDIMIAGFFNVLELSKQIDEKQLLYAGGPRVYPANYPGLERIY